MPALCLHTLCIFNVTLHVSIVQLSPFCRLLSKISVSKVLKIAHTVLTLSQIVVITFVLLSRLALVVNIVDAVQSFVLIVTFAWHVAIVVHINSTTR